MFGALSSYRADYVPLQATKLSIDEGKSLNVETGAMAACQNVTIQTGVQETIWGAIWRAIFGREGVIQNTFTAGRKGGWIVLEETMPGQIAAHTLRPRESLTMKQGAWVASDTDVALNVTYQGGRGMVRGVGLVTLTATNTSDSKTQRVFFYSGKGVLREISVHSNESPVTVDNNNLVAYSKGLQKRVTTMGGLLSGEGLVNEFSGDGKVYIESVRNHPRGGRGEANASLPSASTIAICAVSLDAITAIAVVCLAATILQGIGRAGSGA